MKERLIYLPCEMYRERWTEVVSGEDGMFERQVKKLGVELLPIRPDNEVKSIRTGVVLDTVARCKWAFAQTTRLVEMIFNNEINPGKDVIYIEDFWHPGFEMIPYALSLKYGKAIDWPDIYSFCHAQSVDTNDFTYQMLPWIRRFEKAFDGVLDGIFCAAEEMQQMYVEGIVGEKDVTIGVHDTGTVFDSSVITALLSIEIAWPKKKQVIFSSRWDKEKQPHFFMNLIEAVLFERNDIVFVVSTGADRLNSNDPNAVSRLASLMDQYPNNVKLETGQTKKDYYKLLRDSKVQFNCALQDFVSYTLLEAAAFGCAPLYPKYLTFPDALHHNEKHLYIQNSITDAREKLYRLIDGPAEDYTWVYAPYENSVHRMLKIMGFNVPEVKSLAEELAL